MSDWLSIAIGTLLAFVGLAVLGWLVKRVPGITRWFKDSVPVRKVLWLVRHLFRLLGKLTHLRHYIGGTTALEDCQAELAQCRSQIAEANKRRETELADLRFLVSKTVMTCWQINYSYVNYSQLTSAYRNDENAKRLLDEHKNYRHLVGIGLRETAQALRDEGVTVDNLSHDPEGRIIVRLFEAPQGMLVEVNSPLDTVLRELYKLRNVAEEDSVFSIIQDTIKHYEKMKDAVR